MAGKVASDVMLAVVAVINVLSTGRSSDVQNWSTGMQVGALLMLSTALLSAGRGFSQSGTVFWPDHASGTLFSGMGLGMIGVLWAYEGWQYVTFSAGETANPQRAFPRAIVLGT